MRGFDILVHCSTRPEPFGRVIAEGQASGVAVVAVNSGGSAEVFREGESGLGVEINNRESLRQAIRRLLTDPSLRQKLADQGPEWVASRFDRERLAEQWHDLYQTVL
jgi:glycosyltransferase involved in cell wall biosynthesis